MRKLTMIILLTYMALPVFAQEETLIRQEIESGGFGAPVVKLTGLNDELGVMVGGRGGWIINHMVSIGGGGYGLANDVPAGVSTPDTLDLEFGYGGLEVEFIAQSDRLVHFTFTTLIGGGGVSLRGDDEGDDDSDRESDAFFVAEPTANVVLNVATFFRIGLGAGYRFVWGVDTPDLDDEDMSGPTGTLTLMFGRF